MFLLVVHESSFKQQVLMEKEKKCLNWVGLLCSWIWVETFSFNKGTNRVYVDSSIEQKVCVCV